MGVSGCRSWSRFIAYEGNHRQKLTNRLEIDFSNTPTKGLAWWQRSRVGEPASKRRAINSTRLQNSQIETRARILVSQMCAVFARQQVWKYFRGGLVIKAHRLVYHSTLGWRVIRNKKVAGSGRTTLTASTRNPYSPPSQPQPDTLTNYPYRLNPKPLQPTLTASTRNPYSLPSQPQQETLTGPASRTGWSGRSKRIAPATPAPPQPVFAFHGSGFRVQGFGFRVSGFGFRVSSFGLQVSD